jgi:TPR repeat protein
LLAAAAKLGQPAAAYNLGLLYLEGRQFPQDFKRAAELFQIAAQAGTPEAQYALATLYKDGRGVAQDPIQATRLMGEAAKADFLDAEVEYAIALFNGTGTGKDETRAAALFRKAAMQGSPIAQNRLARIYAFGRGVPKPDPVQAIRWHLISKAGGASDLYLDDYTQKQSPEVRAAAEQAAKPWLDVLAASRPQ